MKKVAKLVTVSLTTRVVVNEDASEQDIIDKASKNLVDKVHNELMENIEAIQDDIECPYDEEIDGPIKHVL